ncbi:MAG: hypothetical protein EOS85_17995 [Mesorhizobium sp.]|nr:MAG: hypothetical protein EOS85_17995 [Mesorhizobium sp.]
MALEKELLNRLLAGRDPNEVFARDGLLDEGDTGNADRRNGNSKKSVPAGRAERQDHLYVRARQYAAFGS